MNALTYLVSVKRGGRFRGRDQLIKYLEGGRLTQGEAILAKCYDCMGFYNEGKKDCGIASCALYRFMPYNPNKLKSRTPKASQSPQEDDEDLEEGNDTSSDLDDLDALFSDGSGDLEEDEDDDI